MRQRNEKNYYKQKINTVLVYIQENIQASLNLEKLAEIASISPYHFHRIFSAHVGESLHAYIKRIRLENAAFRLCHTKESVTDIALSSGYSSLAAFTKAFGKHFGESPNQVRSNGRLEKQSKAGQWPTGSDPAELAQPEYQNIPDQTVIFVRRTGDYQDAAKEAWSSIMQYAYENSLFQSSKVESIGITYDSPEITDDEFVRYDACLALENQQPVKAVTRSQAEVGVQTLRGGQYAVFTHVGPYESLWKTYKAIYGQWLQDSNVSLRNYPSFARYLNSPSDVSPDMLTTQIFIPVEHH